MMNGKMLETSLFGESHGEAVGVLIEGCPPGIDVDKNELKKDLQRRKGLKEFSTEREEEDIPKILSGVFKGYTTGTPIAVVFDNDDVDSSDYEKTKDLPRPGHADYATRRKYDNFEDYRGGGYFSGRLTVGTVTAGYFAKKILERKNIEIISYIKSIKDVTLDEKDIDHSEYEYCPDKKIWNKMKKRMRTAKQEGDSVGGTIKVKAMNVPEGLGPPHSGNLESELSSEFFSIPAVKGVEIGEGFELTKMKGSESNDDFMLEDGKIRTKTNHSGGVLGGISNGMPLEVMIGIKPTPSIYKIQRTVDMKAMEETDLKLEGRFDPCIVTKALPIVEAKMAMVLAEKILRWLSWRRFVDQEKRLTK